MARTPLIVLGMAGLALPALAGPGIAQGEGPARVTMQRIAGDPAEAPAHRGVIRQVSMQERGTQPGSATQTSVVTIERDGQTIVVREEGGRLRVQRDGREVPADRIERRGSVLIIRDEAGEQVATVDLGLGEASRAGGDRPMLGITLDEPDPVLRSQLGLPEGAGVVVLSTIEGMPAGEAGLRAGDVIVGLAERENISPAQLAEALAERRVGEEVEVRVLRRGEPRSFRVELAPMSQRRAEIVELEGLSGRIEQREVQSEQLRAIERALESMRGQRGDEAEVARRALEQAMEQMRAAEERTREMTVWVDRLRNGNQRLFTDDGNQFVFRAAPQPPTPPTPPGIDGGVRRLEERIAALESRLDRLDRSIERLLERLEE